MPALVDLVVVDELAIRPLGPASRGLVLEASQCLDAGGSETIVLEPPSCQKTCRSRARSWFDRWAPSSHSACGPRPASTGSFLPQAGLAALRPQIVPAITRLPRFRSGKWLTGNESGQGLSLTLWDTAEAANVMAERFGIGSSPRMSATVARREIREVDATA